MLLIFGINPVKKNTENSLRRNCPHCNDLRTFQEIQVRQFLSLFFIPIIPISRPSSIFSCVTCGYSITPEMAAEISETFPADNDDSANRVVAICPRCDGPMYIPVKEYRQSVICPHCTMEFNFKGIKENIPKAFIKDQPCHTS